MTGKTHRNGGFLCSVVGFALLRHYGYLMAGVNEGLQWLVMYPFCMWGSVASDLDHHWMSSPMKDPPSYVINKLLHLTAPIQKSLEKSGDTKSGGYKFAKMLNASHRSWQTHSDLTLLCVLFLLHAVMTAQFQVSAVESVLLRFVLTGVCLGLVAHFILDMLTTDGVWCLALVALKKVFPALPDKIRLVPHWSCFKTAGSWEQFINKVLKVGNIIAMIWLLWTVLGLQKYIPFEISIGG